jgi:hypothetical protein
MHGYMNFKDVYWINVVADGKWRVVVNLGKETSGSLQGGEFLQSSISEFNCFFGRVSFFKALTVKCRLNN